MLNVNEKAPAFAFQLCLGLMAILTAFLLSFVPTIVQAMPGSDTSMPNSEMLGVVRDDLTEAKRAKLPKGHFTSVNSCTCHRELLNQWKDSMHSKALTDPFFRYEYELIKEEDGQKAADFCLTCHAPGELLTNGEGALDADEGTNGLVCTVCHQIAGQTVENEKIGNASFGYSNKNPDGILRAQLEDPKGASHPALEEPYYNTAEYCGNCHQLALPQNDLVIDNTYKDWAASSFAKEGKTCQNCHMFKNANELQAPYKGIAGVGGKERENIFGMTFVGGNVEQSDAKLATALLQSAAKVEIAYEGKDILAAGDTVPLKVKVTNVGAGHALPGGITGLSVMWLSVSSVDVNGEDKQEIGRFDFSPRLLDKEGNAVGAEFHKAEQIQDDNRLLPGASKESEFSFTMPASDEARYFLAELKYQTAHDEVIEPSGVANPITVMASADTGFFVSEEARKTAEDIRAEAKRMDDLGGLLIEAEGNKVAFELPGWAKIALYILGGIVLLGIIAAAIVFLKPKKKYQPRHSVKK